MDERHGCSELRQWAPLDVFIKIRTCGRSFSDAVFSSEGGGWQHPAPSTRGDPRCPELSTDPLLLEQDPACLWSLVCFPDGTSPHFPPLQTPRNGDLELEPPHPHAAPCKLCPEPGRRWQHLTMALQPSSNVVPLVSPQEKYHLGLRCNRSDVVWKERRICFNLWRVGLQPKYTGGLQARLYPGPLPGHGPNPALHLGRASSCSAVSGQFTPGFHRGSSGGAEVSPLPSAPPLKLVWSRRELTAKHRRHPRSCRSAPAVARAGGDVIEIHVKRVLMKENQACVLHPP